MYVCASDITRGVEKRMEKTAAIAPTKSSSDDDSGVKSSWPAIP